MSEYLSVLLERYQVRRTKKQKKYYKQAKKRAQGEENDRVDRLFALIANHSANIPPLSA